MMTARSDPSRAQSACTAGSSMEQLGDNGFKYAEIDASQVSGVLSMEFSPAYVPAPTSLAAMVRRGGRWAPRPGATAPWLAGLHR